MATRRRHYEDGNTEPTFKSLPLAHSQHSGQGAPLTGLWTVGCVSGLDWGMGTNGYGLWAVGCGLWAGCWLWAVPLVTCHVCTVDIWIDCHLLMSLIDGGSITLLKARSCCYEECREHPQHTNQSFYRTKCHMLILILKQQKFRSKKFHTKALQLPPCSCCLRALVFNYLTIMVAFTKCAFELF